MGFARNVYFTIKDGKGLVSQTIVLHDRKGVGFTLWNDKAAADAYDLKTYAEVLKRLTPMLEAQPKVEHDDRVMSALRS